MSKLLLFAMLLSALPALVPTVTAQTVSSSSELYLGSPKTKLYYSSRCEEAKKLRWEVHPSEFGSPEAAEKAGFTAGECTITGPDRKAEPPVGSAPQAERPDRGTKVEFVGDKTKKLYYPFTCDGLSSIPPANSIAFTNRDPKPEDQGFSLSEKCPEVPKPEAPKTTPKTAKPIKKSTPPRVHKLLKLIELTSEPRDYLGKVLVVDADVEITSYFKNSDNDYSFRLSDGSASIYVYMEKSSAQKLRNLLLREDSVSGRFVFVIDPDGYYILKQLYGKLVSYNVAAY